MRVLLNVPSKERQVEDQRNPVAVDQEEEGQEAVDGSFGNDVRVEAVAKIDGVDVVTGFLLSARARYFGAAPDATSAPGCGQLSGDRGYLARSKFDVPFQVAVHDSEEDLKEKVDGVEQHRQEVQPRFSGHHVDGFGLVKRILAAIGQGREEASKSSRGAGAIPTEDGNDALGKWIEAVGGEAVGESVRKPAGAKTGSRALCCPWPASDDDTAESGDEWGEMEKRRNVVADAEPVWLCGPSTTHTWLEPAGGWATSSTLQLR